MNDPAAPAFAPVPTRTSGLAIASLVMGILGIGLPAIICGHMARGQIKRSPGLTGAGLALAGLILGYISMILVGIIVLLGVLIGFSGGVARAAQEQAAEAKLHEISAKVETYRMISGMYPSEEQGLGALVDEPTSAPLPRRWKKQFDAIPIDPWGIEFQYRLDPDMGYEVFSFGEDGEEGTEDDLSTKTLTP